MIEKSGAGILRAGALFIALFITGISVAQNSSPKADQIFTKEDWDKLSTHEKDSITKYIFEQYKQGAAANQNSETEEANTTITEALKNLNGTRSLHFILYPKANFSSDLTKFKNLEEFSCERCKALDLTALFNQLSQLPKLKKLDISGGEFKTLPDNIGKLINLEELKLKDNNFVTLPDSFINLKKLKVLSLEHNAYLYDDSVYNRLKYLFVEDLNFSASGLLEVSEQLGVLHTLKRLDLSINDIKVLPQSFSQLSELRYLRLDRNLHLDLVKIISVLSPLSGLAELDAQECNIDNLPLDIGKLTNLKRLDLKSDRLTSLPLTFGDLANLEYLDLGYAEMGGHMNKISDLGPSFGHFKKLKYLNLSGNVLTSLPEGFAGLTDLEYLNISLNKLSAFPMPVTSLTKLQQLDLSLNDIHAVPAQLGNLEALVELHIDGNFFNKPDKKIKALPEEICRLKNLQTLTLKDNIIEQLPDCFGSLSKLQKLDLRDNLLDTFPASFTQLKNLKWLDLKANDFSELPTDFQKLTALKEVNLAMNGKMSYDVEKEKLKKMQQLEFIDLSYNNITKAQITPLREALPNCKVINWDYSQTH